MGGEYSCYLMLQFPYQKLCTFWCSMCAWFSYDPSKWIFMVLIYELNSLQLKLSIEHQVVYTGSRLWWLGCNEHLAITSRFLCFKISNVKRFGFNKHLLTMTSFFCIFLIVASGTQCIVMASIIYGPLVLLLSVHPPHPEYFSMRYISNFVHYDLHGDNSHYTWVMIFFKIFIVCLLWKILQIII